MDKSLINYRLQRNNLCYAFLGQETSTPNLTNLPLAIIVIGDTTFYPKLSTHLKSAGSRCSAFLKNNFYLYLSMEKLAFALYYTQILCSA